MTLWKSVKGISYKYQLPKEEFSYKMKTYYLLRKNIYLFLVPVQIFISIVILNKMKNLKFSLPCQSLILRFLFLLPLLPLYPNNIDK